MREWEVGRIQTHTWQSQAEVGEGSGVLGMVRRMRRGRKDRHTHTATGSGLWRERGVGYLTQALFPLSERGRHRKD